MGGEPSNGAAGQPCPTIATIIRCDGRFRFLPETNRHYAARAQGVLDAIMIAPAA